VHSIVTCSSPLIKAGYEVGFGGFLKGRDSARGEEAMLMLGKRIWKDRRKVGTEEMLMKTGIEKQS
jgi:hypothetical protein